MPEDTAQITRHLVLFDGVCVLCDGTMRFLYKHDRAKRLWYASLQGTVAAGLDQRYRFLEEGLRSVVFVEEYGGAQERVYYRSDAAIHIARKLPGIWRMLAWAAIIPRPLRDGVYEWVARNRYRWFGQKESCTLPEPAMRERYLG